MDNLLLVGIACLVATSTFHYIIAATPAVYPFSTSIYIPCLHIKSDNVTLSSVWWLSKVACCFYSIVTLLSFSVAGFNHATFEIFLYSNVIP